MGSCLCQGGFLDGHACQQRKMGNDQENQHTTKTELKDARDHFSTSLTISSTTPLDALQDTGRKGRMLPSAKIDCPVASAFRTAWTVTASPYCITAKATFCRATALAQAPPSQ